MSVHCFTSISLNYLAKARVLARTLKAAHPNWRLTIFVTDRCPADFEINKTVEDFDDVVWAEEFFGGECLGWIFQHDVVEICTAVKGPMLERMTQSDFDYLIYLDPDTAVFNSLEPLIEILSRKSIVLTPHQLTPETSDVAVWDNEICSLAHGTYNLGFVAIRNNPEGRSFARWWSERLLKYCIDDKANGLFVDQKWCDLAPALFDGVEILRDPGYNVASWNLSNRKIDIGRDGSICVNGKPLRFFHFTKLGTIGDVMTQKYAKDNVDVYELWSWYKRMVQESQPDNIPIDWWSYGRFSNGVKIPKSARRLYRNRQDLQRAFRNPFESEGDSFFAWLKANGEFG